MTLVGRRHTRAERADLGEDGVRVERVVEVHVQIELARLPTLRTLVNRRSI